MLEMELWVINAVSVVLLVIGLQCNRGHVSDTQEAFECDQGIVFVPCLALNRLTFSLEDAPNLALQ